MMHPMAWRLPRQEELDGGVSEHAIEDSASSCTTQQSKSSQDTDTTVSSSGRVSKRKRRSSKKLKRPMGLFEAIVDLQNLELRETTLRSLSTHLIEKRGEDVYYYRCASFYLFNSCTTMVVLLQEILAGQQKLATGDLDLRGSKRLGNVLTIFQGIAANPETRPEFLAARLPNYLVPFILAKETDEIHESVRSVCLSVVGILCQDREDYAIKWALESDMVSVCIHALEFGSELSKVIAIHVLESVFLNESGLETICNPQCGLLETILKVFFDLILVLATAQGFSPRIIYHIIRCYILLCQQPRAIGLICESLPRQLRDDTFQELMDTYQPLHQLHQQLLAITGFVHQIIPWAGKKQKSASSSGEHKLLSNSNERQEVATAPSYGPYELKSDNKEDTAQIQGRTYLHPPPDAGISEKSSQFYQQAIPRDSSAQYQVDIRCNEDRKRHQLQASTGIYPARTGFDQDRQLPVGHQRVHNSRFSQNANVYEDTINRLKNIQMAEGTAHVADDSHTPLRPVDFNQQMWCSAVRKPEIRQSPVDRWSRNVPTYHGQSFG